MTDETSLERERIGLRQALILGTSQRPLEVPSWLAGDNPRAGRLALVAALGLRSRFDHPSPPPHLQRAGFAHEPARLVSQAARSALRRIYGAKKRVVLLPITLRIVDALAERRLCLHPFDYPALAQMLATNDAALDRNARLFHALARSGDNAVAAQDIDERNWADFKPAERAAFLRERRRADPKAARELLAGTIGAETAAVRGQLLEAMAVGLSGDDVEFLRGLANDRADSVRTLARRLTARIAGTSEFEERMSTAHERLEVKSAGIIGRRKVLTAKLPKGLAEAKVEAWLDDSFASVSTTSLAKRLKLSLEQFVESLTDERLRALFFANALALDETETARAIASSLETAAEARRIAAVSRAALAALDSSHRAEMWDAFRPVLAAAALEERCALAAELYEILRVPPRRSVMSPAEAAKPWLRWADAAQNAPDTAQPEIAEILIAFAAAADRDEWRARLADLPPAISSTALALADLLDALDLQSKTNS